MCRVGQVYIWRGREEEMLAYGMGCCVLVQRGRGGGILDCYAFASVKFNMGLDSVGTVQNSRV